jgi:leucyl-tRNA synthetase
MGSGTQDYYIEILSKASDVDNEAIDKITSLQVRYVGIRLESVGKYFDQYFLDAKQNEINQIDPNSNITYLINKLKIAAIQDTYEIFLESPVGSQVELYPIYLSKKHAENYGLEKLERHVPIEIVDNLKLNTTKFKNIRDEYKNASFYLENGVYYCGEAVEKMSKSKYNVINPDDVVAQYGADTFRMYEMFLGPIDQAKPWDTKGIDGVSKFLRKLWTLFFDANGAFHVSNDAPTKAELKTLHTCIKKVQDDIERFSFNTCVSAFMICVNELRSQNCNKRAILEDLVKLIAPFAPFTGEELWHQLGNETSLCQADAPVLDESHLVEDSIQYPISINGKKRDLIAFPADASKEELEKMAMELDTVQKWLEGKSIKKVIVVPKRMINIVVG